jgi:hypothetical protein
MTAAACGHDVGDECQSSADCDPNGTRACDLSQPGGYCTIVGCNETSCPSDSACIRYFPEMFLDMSMPCDPACEDFDCPDGRQDVCAADELCLDSGLCAKRTSEQRQCAKTCGGNDDCRGGYQCRKSGTGGSMLLSNTPAAMTGFCSPLP